MHFSEPTNPHDVRDVQYAVPGTRFVVCAALVSLYSLYMNLDWLSLLFGLTSLRLFLFYAKLSLQESLPALSLALCSIISLSLSRSRISGREKEMRHCHARKRRRTRFVKLVHL